MAPQFPPPIFFVCFNNRPHGWVFSLVAKMSANIAVAYFGVLELDVWSQFLANADPSSSDGSRNWITPTLQEIWIIFLASTFSPTQPQALQTFGD